MAHISEPSQRPGNWVFLGYSNNISSNNNNNNNNYNYNYNNYNNSSDSGGSGGDQSKSGGNVVLFVILTVLLVGCVVAILMFVFRAR